jgi:lysyl-tRNA synthetase class 2
MSDAVFEHKKEKFLQLRDQFADQFEKTHTCEQALVSPEGTVGIRAAGRVVGMRTMGKLIFAHLYDFTGRIQLMIRRTEEHPEVFEHFTRDVAVGDFVGVTGEIVRTKTGEITIRVESYTLLNKCLRTLPEKFHGLEDMETRYRQRYLDIVTNSESREVFRKRIAIVKSLRNTLESQSFLEVETPVLQTQQSGALARPFYTQHNALNIQCVMRIAPETYLKRCIGAGFDRVYEFARCFRNEGISPSHLQDFTMVEFYAAYWNADRGIKFVQEMFRKLINDVFGEVKVKIAGHEVDFSGEWPVYQYTEIIKEHSGIDITVANTREALVAELKAKNIFIEDLPKLDWPAIVDNLYKKVARPKLIQPCFLVKYPAAMSPLARRNAADPDFVDQFQFLVAGVELVKAYSELVDPLDQRERFESQMDAREKGDDEAMPLDEDFLLAMEHGFPPICGVGIGIDRLTQILCGCENIKDTVLFPLMRPL